MSSIQDIQDIPTRSQTEPLGEKSHSGSFLKAEPNEHVQKRKGGRKSYASAEERKQRNCQAQAAFRERRMKHIEQLETNNENLRKIIENVEQNYRVAAEEFVMLQYEISLFERILVEKGINAQAKLGIESDLVPSEHATAAQQNNSDVLSEAAAIPLNPAFQGERTSSYSNIQAQPQHSQPHLDVALDPRSKKWRIHIEQLENEYNDNASGPLDDEKDSESSYGPGPYPLDYNYQLFPNNSLLHQTGFQSLLEPSVTPQQGNIGAYALDTEQFGGMANVHFSPGFGKALARLK